MLNSAGRVLAASCAANRGAELERKQSETRFSADANLIMCSPVKIVSTGRVVQLSQLRTVCRYCAERKEKNPATEMVRSRTVEDEEWWLIVSLHTNRVIDSYQYCRRDTDIRVVDVWTDEAYPSLCVVSKASQSHKRFGSGS